MNTSAKVALAVAVLSLFGCLPGPRYFYTTASCARSDLTFPQQSINGVDGFTDYSGSISEDTAIKMLAERRVKFIEQKALTTASNLPFGLIVQGVEKDSFAKLWIDEAGASACITNNEHLQFGVTYDLYTHGMKPSECLAGAVVTQPVGKYRLEAHYKNLMGVSNVEYEVLDGFTGSKVAAIQSSQMDISAGASKLPLPRGFYAGCYAKQQTVANLFQESVDQASPVPPVRDIDTNRPLSGTVKFIRTQMSKDEFLKINLLTDQPVIKLASKGQTTVGHRTVAIADERFIGHYSFPSQIGGMRPHSTSAGMVLLSRDKVTFVWRGGEVQNLEIAVDEGKITQMDGFRVVGDRLLVFAVTDWAKGWAVFEASLGDFDVSVARRVMAEVASIDEDIKTRFVVQDIGLVHDLQTGLIWAQADSGQSANVAYASELCSRKGANWKLPSASQLSGIFLSTGSISAKCGGQPCYVSPAFKLSSRYLWSRDVDDAGTPFIMNLYSGSLEANKYPNMPDIAQALCVRSN